MSYYCYFLAICFLASFKLSTSKKPHISSPISEKPYIIQGSRASLGSHPYIVSIQVLISGYWFHFCGGVIISPNKVLTAAHCLTGDPVVKRVVVGTVMLSATQSTNIFPVRGEYIHPNYNPSSNSSFANDIGIIVLSINVMFNSNVQPAQIAPVDSNFDNTRCSISGWGRTSAFAPGSNELLEANVTAISNTQCRSLVYPYPLYASQICTYQFSGAKTFPRGCKGDSGGPLVCGPNFEYLVGVFSFNFNDCTSFEPGVYTRVTSFLDFIASQ